jgi:hypothetical protein
MDPLDYYILQARTSGQPDRISRDNLLQAGWPAAVIDKALGLGTSANAKPKSSSKKKKYLILSGVLLSLILIIIIVSSVLSGPKVSDTTVAVDFMAYVNEHAKAKADSLESSTLKAHALKTAGTTSFEKFCLSTGQSCTYFFSNAFINNATASYGNYTSIYGVKGRVITLTYKGKVSNSTSCSGSTYTNSLQIGLIPSGNSWLVDSVGLNSSNGACNPD